MAGSLFKTIASVALPVIGTAIAGPVGGYLGAAAGGAIGGGGLKGALMGAAGYGLGNIAGGGLSGALGGKAGGGGLSSMFGKGGLSSALGLGGEAFGPMNPLQTLLKSGETIAWNTPSSGLSNIAWNAAPKENIFGGLGQSLGLNSNDMMGTAKKLLDIYSATQDPDEKYPGLVSQEQIQNDIAARKAEQERQNKKFIEALNAGPLNRKQVPQTMDFSKYGQSPGSNALFFDEANPALPQVSLKRGGLVRGPGGPRDDMVPANLSNGEFVLTAKAVKGAGKGDIFKGANKLKKLDKKLSKKGGLAMAMSA